MPAKHVRAQIRDALVAKLLGLPTTGAEVFAGRTRPLASNHLPTLLVYAVSEQSEPHAMGGVLGRVLTVAVEGRVTMGDVPDDVLDRIALEVEPVMVSDPRLGGLTFEITLIGTTINAQAPGDRQAGEIIMRFRVQYRTLESAPEAAV